MSVKQFERNRCLSCRVTKSCCVLCGMCVTCGGCRPMRCTNNIPKVYAATTFMQNRLRRALGIEYEIGSFNDSLSGTLQRFSDAEGNHRLRRDRDGSVRPSEVEWVTHPIAGDDALEVLTFMSDLLNRSKYAEVNETCGYHVHVDACKESAFAIRKFLYLYLKIEAEVYNRLCSPERTTSTFCYPLTNLILQRRPGTNLDTLKDMSKAIEFLNFIMSLYGLRVEEAYDIRINRQYWQRLAADRHAFGYERRLNPRYCGLNIHAWYKQGSIEWRMKEMTLKHTCEEDDDLKYWPLFCGWITHIGLNMKLDDLVKINTLEDIEKSGHLPKNVAAWLHHKRTSTRAPLARMTAPAQIRNERIILTAARDALAERNIPVPEGLQVQPPPARWHEEEEGRFLWEEEQERREPHEPF
jgi:hypothetical protein